MTTRDRILRIARVGAIATIVASGTLAIEHTLKPIPASATGPVQPALIALISTGSTTNNDVVCYNLATFSDPSGTGTISPAVVGSNEIDLPDSIPNSITAKVVFSNVTLEAPTVPTSFPLSCP
jgi:hypothetical protein